jgi:hypothetical protein
MLQLFHQIGVRFNSSVPRTETRQPTHSRPARRSPTRWFALEILDDHRQMIDPTETARAYRGIISGRRRARREFLGRFITGVLRPARLTAEA